MPDELETLRRENAVLKALLGSPSQRTCIARYKLSRSGVVRVGLRAKGRLTPRDYRFLEQRSITSVAGSYVAPLWDWIELWVVDFEAHAISLIERREAASASKEQSAAETNDAG